MTQTLQEREPFEDNVHTILKELANESWREGHNGEPGNEVGYWIKEALPAILSIIQEEKIKELEYIIERRKPKEGRPIVYAGDYTGDILRRRITELQKGITQ